MLSPGTWYKEIPKDPDGNSDYRASVMAQSSSSSFQSEFKDKCAQDILFYLNSVCWTYDPRTWHGKLIGSVPFVSYPFQDRAFLTILECIENARDLVIEKSRDMGATWMCLYAMEWMFHFHRDTSFLAVSRKENLVDAPGDPDSLFWKIDFIHRNLPPWLCPSIDRRKLHFGNVDNNSTIDGESTTAAAGVGGRRTAMFIDEFSRIEEGYQLLAGTADTTRCRIFNFTPFGTSGASHKLSERVRRGELRGLRLHWSEHPEKAAGAYRYDSVQHRVVLVDTGYQHDPEFNFILDGKIRSPWYDGECLRRANDREVAQMLDIDYQGSQYAFFDRNMISQRQREDCFPAFWEGDIYYDRDTGRPHGLVQREGGPLKLWLHPDGDKMPRGKYGMGADISTGTGATPSCISVGNAQTGEKVAEYTEAYKDAKQLAPLATALAWMFKDEDDEPALFAWEMQGPGTPFGRRVLELGYRNVFYRRDEQKIDSLPSDTPGWFPSNDNRRDLLEEYREALALRKFINRSHQALEECNQFLYVEDGTVRFVSGSETYDSVTGKPNPTGANVNHGDHVIADGLCYKMMRDQGGPMLKPDQIVPVAPVGSLGWRRLLAEEEKRKSIW